MHDDVDCPKHTTNSFSIYNVVITSLFNESMRNRCAESLRKSNHLSSKLRKQAKPISVGPETDEAISHSVSISAYKYHIDHRLQAMNFIRKESIHGKVLSN